MNKVITFLRNYLAEVVDINPLGKLYNKVFPPKIKDTPLAARSTSPLEHCEASIHSQIDENCLVMVMPQYYTIAIRRSSDEHIQFRNAYTMLKEMWLHDHTLISYDFPVVSLTEFSFIYGNGGVWKIDSEDPVVIIDIKNSSGGLGFLYDLKARAEALSEMCDKHIVHI